MNNIEQIIVRLKTRVALAELIGPDDVTVSVSDLSALIAQLEAAQKERDALREVHIGAGSNTRAAADIYFQLVEELQVPAGGSLVGVIDNLKAELSAANEKLSKPVLLPDGWRLAPIMPTNAMIDAFRVAYEHDDSYADHWIRMLAAAPRPTGFTVEGE